LCEGKDVSKKEHFPLPLKANKTFLHSKLLRYAVEQLKIMLNACRLFIPTTPANIKGSNSSAELRYSPYMADFIVVRQPSGSFVRVHDRFYRCLPTFRLIRPDTISDFGVSPPTNAQLVIDTYYNATSRTVNPCFSSPKPDAGGNSFLLHLTYQGSPQSVCSYECKDATKPTYGVCTEQCGT
jgi:hypothetical protein